jgi:hypothetical protein
MLLIRMDEKPEEQCTAHHRGPQAPRDNCQRALDPVLPRRAFLRFALS